MDNLTKEEIESIQWYKGEGYDIINKSLRRLSGSVDTKLLEKLIEEVEIEDFNHIKNIDNVLKRSPYYKGKLYRGLNDVKYNETFINYSYCSSTYDIRVAEEFSGNDCCLLSFNLTKNDKIHYIDMNQFYKKYFNKEDDEKEILLDRDLIFQNIRLIGLLETQTAKEYSEKKIYSCIVQNMQKLNIESLIKQKELETEILNTLIKQKKLETVNTLNIPKKKKILNIPKKEDYVNPMFL